MSIFLEKLQRKTKMSAKSITIVYKREFKTFFTSPGAYIIITLFLIIIGWFFFSTFFLSGSADMRNFFNLLPLILAFGVPAVSMRLFSEEYKSGSFEILKTLPVTDMDIIFGKYLASLFFTLIMIAPTLVYPIFISFLGDLDWGPVIGGYLGAILLAGAFSGIGILASSLTKNQVVAFILSAAFCFFLTVINKSLIFLPSFLTGFLQYLSTDYHFNNIAKGIIDSRDIVYFLTVIFLALYGTYIVNRERS